MRALSTVAIAIIALAAPGQDAQEPAEADIQAVTEALEGLKQAHKDKVDADQIHFIKILGEKWAAADDKQRKEIHSLARRNLSSRNLDVRNITTEMLGSMGGGEKNRHGDAATRILEAETNKKTTEEDITYFGAVLRSIGRLQHPKGIQILTKLLKYKDYDVVASAVDALASYKDASIEEKKEIVDELLKRYSGLWSAAKNPQDTTAKQRLEKVNRPMEATLKTVTGQQEPSGFDAWWDWWLHTGKKAKSW